MVSRDEEGILDKVYAMHEKNIIYYHNDFNFCIMKYENAYLHKSSNKIKLYCLDVHFLKSMNEKIAYLVKNYIFISEWPS